MRSYSRNTGRRDIGLINTWLRTQLFKIDKLTSQYFAPGLGLEVYFSDDGGISWNVNNSWKIEHERDFTSQTKMGPPVDP